MNSPKRKLSLAMAMALVLGNMIGSGIFLLPASLAPFGWASLLGWLISGTGAVLLALTFVYLTKSTPMAGGIYAYAKQSFGDYLGFLVAWGYWLSIWAGNAAIAVAAIGYLTHFFPQLERMPGLSAALAIGGLWVLIGVNLRGIEFAGWLQLITTILKIAPLLILAMVGIAYFTPENLAPSKGGIGVTLNAATATASLTLWAFLGLESATIPAEDVIHPKRTVPLATLGGTLLAGVVYGLSTLVVMGLVPATTLAQSPAPFADAARAIGGPIAGHGMAVVALIATFGALNGWVLLSGHVPWAAARDGLFPARLARRNKNQVPALGMAVTGIASSLIILLNYHKSLVEQFTFVILLSTLTTLVPYVFCTMAALMKMRSRPDAKHGAGMKLVVLSAFVFSLWAIAGAGKDAVFYGFLLLMAGTPFYVYLKSQPNSRSGGTA